jgi:hypothetical protein
MFSFKQLITNTVLECIKSNSSKYEAYYLFIVCILLCVIYKIYNIYNVGSLHNNISEKTKLILLHQHLCISF